MYPGVWPNHSILPHEYADETGNEEAADEADKIGKFLVNLMIGTLLLVAICVLYPPARFYTDLVEKALILVRVVMTVKYGHIIHKLRRVVAKAISQQPTPTQRSKP